MQIFHKEESPLLALKMEGACGKEHTWPVKAESRSLPTVSKEYRVEAGICVRKLLHLFW